MSSIAYVSDSNMLEYHRLNGNQSIVFWRLSMRNFTDFYPGDLLFFMDKGNENRKNNEKAIVGYGVFAGSKTLSLNSFWKLYETKTGYGSQKALNEAILSTLKSEELPKKINTLFLKDVIFFQAPLYLSELGIDVPTHLESFTYLSQDTTLSLLEKANSIGIDIWTAMMNGISLDTETLDQQILRYRICHVVDEIECSNHERQAKYAKNQYALCNDGMWCDKKQRIFLRFEPQPVLYFTFTSIKETKEQFTALLGRLIYLQNRLETVQSNITLVLLTDWMLNDVQLAILAKYQITYLYSEASY